MEYKSIPRKRGDRILVLTTSYPRFQGDAAGHFVKAEVTALRRRGHSVTVAAAGGPFVDDSVVDLGASELFAYPGALPRLKERPTRALGLVGATAQARRLSADNYDRVLCHWLVPTAYLWGVAFASPRSSLLAVAHGSDVRVLLGLPKVARTHILSSLLRARFELRFVAAELKEALLNAGLNKELTKFVGRAEVRASPIECEGVPSKDLARQALGLRSKDSWAVVVGRLIEGKRTRVALSAADLVPGLNVAIIGSGPLAPSLEAQYPRYRFLGQLTRDEALKWIAAADILISASRSEGAPTAIREARTLGTQVVSVPAGDIERWAKSDAGLWLVSNN